jgi:hypothetical protein
MHNTSSQDLKRQFPSEHGTWKAMMQRCFDEAFPLYRYYGGRGIIVCERWRGPDGFASFLADMGPKPSPTYSLDRHPDQNGNYEPGNCRWATKREQARNRRDNVLLTLNGVTCCLMEWAEKLGVKYITLASRVRAGWSAERTLTTPVAYRPYWHGPLDG